MPYDISTEPDGFYVEHTGHVSFDEIAEANDVLIDHPAYDRHRYQIWNYLGAGAIAGEKRDSRVISKVDDMSLRRASANTVKVAFVVTNAKSIEFINSYLDDVDPAQIDGRIFRTLAEARDWVRGG